MLVALGWFGREQGLLQIFNFHLVLCLVVIHVAYGCPLLIKGCRRVLVPIDVGHTIGFAVVGSDDDTSQQLCFQPYLVVSSAARVLGNPAQKNAK